MMFQTEQPRDGYYDVRIKGYGRNATYRVYACSDYAAAVEVRRVTGRMPSSERDVEFVEVPGTSGFRRFALQHAPR